MFAACCPRDAACAPAALMIFRPPLMFRRCRAMMPPPADFAAYFSPCCCLLDAADVYPPTPRRFLNAAQFRPFAMMPRRDSPPLFAASRATGCACCRFAASARQFYAAVFQRPYFAACQRHAPPLPRRRC